MIPSLLARLRYRAPGASALAAATVAATAPVACDEARTSASVASGGAADGDSSAVAVDASVPSATAPGHVGADAASALHGQVLDATTGRPLSARVVFVGGRRTTTAPDGSFGLDAPGASYEAIISDPDGSAVSVYRGITRLDPVFVHASSGYGTPSNVARLSGTVAGGGSYPLGSDAAVAVYFFSPVTDAYALLGGGLPPAYGGPTFGPMALTWDGDASLAGQLLAVGQFASDAGLVPYVAMQPLTVSAGGSPTAFVEMQLAVTSPLAVTAVVPEGVTLVAMQFYYALGFPHSFVTVTNAPGAARTIHTQVADLRSLGGRACVRAVGTPGLIRTEKCMVPLDGSETSLSLQSPPTLTAPVVGDTITPATMFSWSGFPGGVYSLKLESTAPSPSAPTIDVYTADGSSPWPDLTVAGISFPRQSGYTCTIVGLGPYATLDEATGSGGLSIQVPAEARTSASLPVDLTTM